MENNEFLRLLEAAWLQSWLCTDPTSRSTSGVHTELLFFCTATFLGGIKDRLSPSIPNAPTLFFWVCKPGVLLTLHSRGRDFIFFSLDLVAACFVDFDLNINFLAGIFVISVPLLVFVSQCKTTSR